MRLSLLTRNSATRRLGSTFALAKWPRIGCVVFFALAAPAPSCTAVQPSLSTVRCATTWQPSLCRTVTGTCRPSSVKSRVIPSFFAMTPERITPSSEIDLDIDTGGEVELHQRVHRLGCRVDDIEQTLVRADLELLPALLVDVRAAQHRELLDLVRQRNRAAHIGARPLGGVHDLLRAGVQHAVIEGLQPNPYVLTLHRPRLSGLSCRPGIAPGREL